ncbi:SDR family oxidoreductase [Metabacillus litoralis]|uniref:SDR family oxidoreductase n=1 Tax=Metabacillus litoralis TaxID=152268 RepID=UPI001CFEC45C|nr:SDR family oxidoreductase [Metabacillus litoralis]
MNVLIIGANGHTGRHIIHQINQEEEHKSIAMIRDENQAKRLMELGANDYVIGDLEGNIEHVLEDVEAVIFAAGSGSSTGPDKTTAIDQEGAKRIIDEAKKHSIKHFVMLSSVGADVPEMAPDNMKHYLTAKANADEHLRRSGLTYTIVRPTSLSDDDSNLKIKANASLDDKSKTIPRKAVASVLIKSLTLMETKNETFEITEGEKETVEALKYIH